MSAAVPIRWVWMGLRTPTGRLVCAFGALLLAGCGYLGEPLPPLANVPVRVTNLAAVQRGGRIIAQFSVPLLTTEGKPVPAPARLDLRAGPAEPFEAGAWAAQAKQIPPAPAANGIARYEIPSDDWIGKGVVLGVRMVAGNGKAADWSNFVTVQVVPPPEKPSAVTPVATAGGVKLTWRAQGPQFRVFRKPEEATDFALAATVEQHEWTDAEAEFGKRCTYLVQTVVKLADNKLAESDLSDEASISPVDTFPPAAPADLHATPGPASIELSWEPNTESDLAGYRVYRSAGGGPFEKAADLAAIPTWSDKNVEHGKTYRYAVTAVDRVGNESVRSAAVQAVLE